MTVAAIVLVPDRAVALSDADGEPAIRRVAHSAWSGGAMPIVIVSDDGGEELAAAVDGLPVTISRPGPDEPRGVAWFLHGLRAARSAVAEATAGLLWPARCAWVDPETVTSLVEMHGTAPDEVIRPAFSGQPGFPILVPMSLSEKLATRPDLRAYQVVEALIAGGVPARTPELGDPGIAFDIATPRDQLPGFDGPPAPAGVVAEWNAELAAQAQTSGETGS
jgi:CTP:molybdopterin cytidylyltransferase MocA